MRPTHLPPIRTARWSILFAVMLAACGGVSSTHDAGPPPADGRALSDAAPGDGAAAPADGSACDQVRARLAAALPRTASPGAMVALQSPGEPLCLAAAGVADLATGAPPDPERDHYLIGSSTKTFVAAAILLLARDGVLTDANDTVEHWLPGLLPDGSAIHIGQLLTHTSGLSNYLDVLAAHPERYDTTRPTTPEQIVAMAESAGRLFPPDQPRFSYCNTGYIVLGMIIERASGMPWGEFVRARLLRPLGLAQTYITYRELPADASLMRSYATVNGQDTDITEAVDPSWAGSAGSMVSTLRDMTRWSQALYTGELFAGEYLRLVTSPLVVIDATARLGYGAGVITRETPFGRWTGHGGTVTGSLSSLGGLADRGLFVQSVVNHASGDRFAAADAAWATALGAPLGSLAPFVAR